MFGTLHSLESTKLFLREDGQANVYQINPTPDGVSWAQTFTEKTFSTKTISNQSSINESGVFKKANPATFSFTVPLTKEAGTAKEVFDLLVSTSSNNLKSFTLWFIETDSAICIETCVFTSGAFAIEDGAPMSIQFSGEGGKLTSVKTETANVGASKSIFRDRFLNWNSITSTNSAFPTFTYANIQKPASKTLLKLDQVKVALDKSSIGSNNSNIGSTGYHHDVISTSLEVQNKIKWIPHQTLLGAINTTGSNSIAYPSQYVLENQSVAGNITRVLLSNSLENWSNASDSSGGNQKFHEGKELQLHLADVDTTAKISFGSIGNNINYTSTVQPGPFWTLSADWRLSSSSIPLSTHLIYTTA